MEIKRQIVESKFPPSSKEVWWFDVKSKEIKRYTGGKWTAAITSSGGNTPESDLGLKLSTGSDKELWLKINTTFHESGSEFIKNSLDEICEINDFEHTRQNISEDVILIKIIAKNSFTSEQVKDIFNTFVRSAYQQVRENGAMSDSFRLTLVLPSGINTLVNMLIPTEGVSDYDDNHLTIVSDSITSIESIFDGTSDATWYVSLVLGMDTPPQIQTDSFLVAHYQGLVTIQVPHGTKDRYLKDTNWEIINSEYEIHELEEGISLEDVLASY